MKAGFEGNGFLGLLAYNGVRDVRTVRVNRRIENIGAKMKIFRAKARALFDYGHHAENVQEHYDTATNAGI